MNSMVLTAGHSSAIAETYTIDPMHSRVAFSVRHLGIGNVHGRFKVFTGMLLMDGNKIKEATGTIEVQSVDTGVPKRDEHLQAADFFDAAQYPTIEFKTKRVVGSEDGFVMIADFTMRGVTRQLQLPVTVTEPVKDAWGDVRIGLEAKTKVNRKDYGIKYHALLETGIPVVSDEIQIEISAEAIKATPGTAD